MKKILLFILLNFTVFSSDLTVVVKFKKSGEFKNKILYATLVNQDTYEKQRSKNSGDASEGDLGIKNVEIKLKQKDVDNGYATFEMKDLDNGDYALKSFLDLDGNGSIDVNNFGSGEPWGFSNTKKLGIRFGQPKWKKAKFSIDGDTEIEYYVR